MFQTDAGQVAQIIAFAPIRKVRLRKVIPTALLPEVLTTALQDPRSGQVYQNMLRLNYMRGFTLVELLVVITIMGILGILGFIYNRTFQATQVLNEGVSGVQNILRAAQSNATAGVKCQGLGGATWVVTFENTTTFNLKCKVGTSAFTQKSYSLPTNIQVQSVPCSVNFSPLYGTVSFEPSSASCIIRITNTKTGESKDVTVTRGGAIDAE